MLGAAIGAAMSCALVCILGLALPVAMIALVALGTLLSGGSPFSDGKPGLPYFLAELAVVVVSVGVYSVGHWTLRRMLGARPGWAWFWYFLWPLLLVFCATFFVGGFVAYVTLHGSTDPNAVVVPLVFGLTVAAIGGAIATAQRVSHFYRVTPPRTA